MTRAWHTLWQCTMRMLALATMLAQVHTVQAQAQGAGETGWVSARDWIKQAPVDAQLGLLGETVWLVPAPALTITHPAHWISRRPGEYRYRYVTGGAVGDTDTLEVQQPDKTRPEIAWSRHVGGRFVEEVTVENDFTVRIHTQTDQQQGYRVTLQPGIHIPPGIQPGDSWGGHNTVKVYTLAEPDRVAYAGTLDARRTYVGAFRVKVPAGEFDAILLEERYQLEVGLLSAQDVRHVLYAREVGLIAEVEAIDASALIVFGVKEKAAKVLVAYPR